MRTKLINLFILAFAITACSSSAQVSRDKTNVDTFTKIACSSGIDVDFSHGNSHTFKVETDEENLSKIEIVVENKCLKIKRKDGQKFKRNSSIKVYVTAPLLEDLAFSGGSDFYSKEIKSNKTLNLAFSGGADLNIEKMDANKCNIAFSGGADCKISQTKVQDLRLAFSGGSDAEIKAINANNISVAASGGADVELSGKAKNISVSVSGGADVDIRNLSAENVSSNKSKSGSLKR
jgi:Protein of unknown function (DUF2807).